MPAIWQSGTETNKPLDMQKDTFETESVFFICLFSAGADIGNVFKSIPSVGVEGGKHLHGDDGA